MRGDPQEVPEFSPTPSRVRIWLAVLGLFALAGIGAVMATAARTTLEGLLLGLIALSCGVLGVRLMWLAIQNPVRLTFSKQGLWVDGIGGRRLVEWGNVQAIRIIRRRNWTYNVIKLRDPERYQSEDGNILSKLGRLSRFWYGGEVAISWTMRDRGAKEFGKLIEAWYARYVPPAEDQPASN